MEFRLKSIGAFRGLQVYSIIICPIMEEYTEIGNNKQFLESPSYIPDPLNEACYDRKGIVKPLTIICAITKTLSQKSSWFRK